MCNCTCALRTADIGQVWWVKYPDRTTLKHVTIKEITSGTILVKELGWGPVFRFAHSDINLVERDFAFERAWPEQAIA